MSAGGPYRLLSSGRTKDLVRQLRVDAEVAGISARLIRSLQEIELYLELEPKEWGDPFKRLGHLKQIMYRRIYDKLSVEYSVHDTEPYVWLSRIEPVLGHPLCKHQAE